MTEKEFTHSSNLFNIRQVKHCLLQLIETEMIPQDELNDVMTRIRMWEINAHKSFDVSEGIDN